MNLLACTGVQVTFASRNGAVRAVDAVDLTLEPGDQLALIGESGCGKTVLGMAVLGLLPMNAEVAGEILFEGKNLRTQGGAAMQNLRGTEIAMVMQNSVNSLNPVQRIGEQVAEPLLVHGVRGREEAEQEAVRLLASLGFKDPAAAARQYPHEFSGGMRERILIAIALICNPKLLIADEPTTGLDAQMKRQILRLVQEHLTVNRTLLLITHDLGTATFLSARIAVMYAGEIVECGKTEDVISHPLHPYTQGLIASLPSAGLHPIPGTSPSPGSMPAGCRFAPRCPAKTDRCSRHHPPLQPVEGLRKVRCWNYA